MAFVPPMLAACRPATIPDVQRAVAATASAKTIAATASASASAAPPPIATFTAAARLPFPATLHPVQNALVVANAGARWRGDPILGVLADRRIDLPDAMIAKFTDVGAITGVWPDDLDVHAVFTHVERVAAERWHHGPDGWSRTVGLKNGPLFFGMAELRQATVVFNEAFFDRQPVISSLRGPDLGFRFPPANPADGCDEAWRIAVRSQIELFAIGATGTGALVGVGRNCNNAAMVELWNEGEIFPKLLPIAGAPTISYPSNGPHGIMPGADGEAWIAMGFVARVDANGAEAIAAPSGCTAVAIVAGTPWLRCDEGLFARKGNGWERVTVPPDDNGDAGRIVDIVSHRGKLWVATDRTLWRSTEPNEPHVRPNELAEPYEEILREAQPSGLLPPDGGHGCKHNVALLFRMSDGAPNDFPFPRARAALTADEDLVKPRLAIVRIAERRYLAALPNGFPHAVAVRDAVNRRVPNAAAVIVCSEPEVVAERSLDATP
jgi:hypothetical protein